MSSDAANGRGPADDVPPAADDVASGGGLWADDLPDAFGDAATMNWFSDEIENVSASDWDEDTAQIWGDEDGGSATVDGGDPGGLDFSL